MKVVKLLLATNNAKKVEEIRKILPSGFELLTLNDIQFLEEIPETTNTIPGNSRQKAKYVYERTGLNCLSDDSGLEIEALNGRPGVDSAHYAGLPRDSEKNITRVLNELTNVDNRRARFITILTLIMDGVVHQFEGTVNGVISKYPAGKGGFGYDPIFIADGLDVTFAQIEPSEKNKISHRAKALQLLNDFIASHT